MKKKHTYQVKGHPHLTRKSTRVFTHAVITPNDRTGRMGIIQFTSSSKTAATTAQFWDKNGVGMLGKVTIEEVIILD